MKLWRVPLFVVMVVAFLAPAGVWAREGEGVSGSQFRLFMPMIRRSTVGGGGGGGSVCQSTSTNPYSAGPVYQWDTDNPPRPAHTHADKNVAVRGYERNAGADLRLVDLGFDDPKMPPQLATLFNPSRVPGFPNGYRNFHWNWAPSPTPGTRGTLNTSWPVTVLGMATTAGEALRVPIADEGYSIGGGMAVIVLFADADTVTFKYGREDSVAPHGYTLHIDNICTDPNLVALYNQHNGAGGPRYQMYAGTPNTLVDYNLPNLAGGQVFGRARGAEIRVAIVDSGSWMDPRSCQDWWQIRPGGSC